MFLYGFVGNAPCGGLLLEKLQACTQPGLDGYGAALMQGGQLLCVKSKESVAALAQQLPESAASCGLVHARFATCGGRTAENVHPFVTDDYCLAMNGTVENAVALRSALNLLPYPDSDGAVLAAFNFGDTELKEYELALPRAGRLTPILDTDWQCFGGQTEKPKRLVGKACEGKLKLTLAPFSGRLYKLV